MPVYPIILAGTIVLSAFLDADVSVHAALRSIAIVLFVAAALTILLTVILGGTWGPALAALVVLVSRSGNLTHAALAALLAVLIGTAWLYARRIRPRMALLGEPTNLLNRAVVLLLLATLVTAGVRGSLWRIDMRLGDPPERLAAAAPRAPGDRPDFYVLLLDGYPRADTLQRLFDYDNSGFLDALRGRGFAVADLASSNYMYTAATLTSMHHMAYLEDVISGPTVDVPYGVSLRSEINDNPVWDALRGHGYEIAAAKPPWENEAMRAADIFCGEGMNDFEMFLLRTTLVGQLHTRVAPNYEAQQHREAVDEAFECLGRLSQASSVPKLAFVHVGSPHLPIVFTRSGEAADPILFGQTAQELRVSEGAFADGYVAQLEYLNQRVLEGVDALTARQDEPVVIIFSDHGSESRLNWADALRSDLAERFGILFAARTPGEEPLFPCDVTPVNVYPLLLNAYLGTDFSTREDRQFVSPADDKLRVTEVQDPDLAAGLSCRP